MGLLDKIFGNKYEKDIKKINPLVDEINEKYETLKHLTIGDLPAKTEEFKKYIDDSRNKELEEHDVEALSYDEKREIEFEAEKIAMEEILPEAFGLVKHCCSLLMDTKFKVRGLPMIWDMVPYDVQLVGGIVLHNGKIAEMGTGEGKTLVATMPVYMNALVGKGVHVVTVNDYLATRDSEWMGLVFETLGLTIGCIENNMPPDRRREMYECDITYGTNNEFGFDYLRDNMSIDKKDQVQRGHYYAIVDEVDSVLIDEARTPLIISGPVSVSTHMYDKLNPLIQRTAKAQSSLLNKLILEAEELLKDPKTEYDAGVKLLKASRGGPKNKKLMKILNETGNKKLMRSVENDYIRDKIMFEIDDELFYVIDEKSNVTDLTDKGRNYIAPNDPDMFILPDIGVEIHDIDADENMSLEEKELKKSELQKVYAHRSEQNQNISQLLRAYALFEKDVEYVIQDGKVQIVDEFTGRLMVGRRYSDGLHQAIEAKEGVKIERESQTLATITLQNYFRMYSKLAGMTGTAVTEESEFFEIYNLDCSSIPTNRPIARHNHEDEIYKTKREKYNAVIMDIEEHIKIGRSVLVGTISVDVSEKLARMLKRKGIRHSVLNAKQHQSEAEIVAEAGREGMVTIATNMAGRGTDIKLTPKVKAAGGLHVIGTERHESRRIDLQLRGRCGRQGDPGSTKFFLSLEDDLMRLFAPDRIIGVMDKIGLEDGEVIKHSMITKSIERAQKKVEGHNFGIRKHLLEYDDVMNRQREIIYQNRNNALRGENLKSKVMEMVDEFVEEKIDIYAPDGMDNENWDWNSLNEDLLKAMLLNIDVDEVNKASIKREELEEFIKKSARDIYNRKEEALGEDMMRNLERFAVLRIIDDHWKEHLYEVDQIKEGINLVAYGQKDPLIEYKKQSFATFENMLGLLNEESISLIYRAQLEPQRPQRQQQMSMEHASTSGMGFQAQPEAKAGKKQPVVATEPKVGRNDPCPCGSGKKFKKCHGVGA